ncbi:MAG: type II secretion system protein [Colwellia sp.]|nr:type II secretion system protein [Colwellia sp.]
MKRLSFNKASGFTLIELISVIVILGILAVGVSSFLKFGTQIYVEATARDQIISSARFSVERLNREVRHALPNSPSTYINFAGFSCLQFTPIIASSTYIDLPVLPELSRSTLAIIPFNDDNFAQATKVIVYPLAIADLAGVSDKNHRFSSLDKSTEPWVLNFVSPIHFESDSPSQRVYFISDNVHYCLAGTNLTRNGILMAQNITNNAPFQVASASLRRNALVQIHLQFEKNFEKITFNNEVQVLNVP